jgi:hypothetical protein
LQEENNDENNVIPRYGESCTNDGIWEANCEISARLLYLSILRLRGLWTKTAQYLSSRADFMPVSYIRELSKLQDQAPATEWKDIEATLSGLKGYKKGRLVDIQEMPIASASIGQVHVGYLLKNDDNDNDNNSTTDNKKGEKVAIKVQHPHAYRLMTWFPVFESVDKSLVVVGTRLCLYGDFDSWMVSWGTEGIGFPIWGRSFTRCSKGIRIHVSSSEEEEKRPKRKLRNARRRTDVVHYTILRID